MSKLKLPTDIEKAMGPGEYSVGNSSYETRARCQGLMYGWLTTPPAGSSPTLRRKEVGYLYPRKSNSVYL